MASHPLCEYCLAQGKTKASNVTDHDIPHRGDPELFWQNTFTALCHACHSGTKQRLEARYDGDALLGQVRGK
jgi:5-methylcytosine-specific restriction enzyme A